MTWQHEPDEHRWTDGETGYRCAILRHEKFGTLCGYVAVPPEHPWYGLPHNALVRLPREIYDQPRAIEEINPFGLFVAASSGRDPDDQLEISTALAVHGGITFSGPIDELGGAYWFGFDCAHAGDVLPRFQQPLPGEYRTIAYVMSQCAKLARQLREVQHHVEHNKGVSDDDDLSGRATGTK